MSTHTATTTCRDCAEVFTGEVTTITTALREHRAGQHPKPMSAAEVAELRTRLETLEARTAPPPEEPAEPEPEDAAEVETLAESPRGR